MGIRRRKKNCSEDVYGVQPNDHDTLMAIMACRVRVEITLALMEFGPDDDSALRLFLLPLPTISDVALNAASPTLRR